MAATPPAGEGLSKAVEEEGPVREPGQGVVEGLLEHGLLGGLALVDVADVQHQAVHGGIVEEVADDAFDPPPCSVGMAHPIFDGGSGVGGRHAGFPGGDHEVEVVGVDEAPPRGAEDRIRVVAEHTLRRRTGVQDLGVAIEQDGDVGRVLHEATEALLTLGQRLERLLEVHPGVLVLAPRDKAGDALSEDKRPVDERPLPRVVERGLMVVHGARGDDAHRAVLDDDEADGEEKGNPVLVEAEHHDHHEVVEVHLDDAA